MSMTEIIRELEQNDPVVELTDKCDVICRKCPHNINGVCLSEQKVTAIDSKCIQKYGLSFGDKLHWSKLKYLAFEKIIDCRKLEEVCKNCQWLGICRLMNIKLHGRL